MSEPTRMLCLVEEYLNYPATAWLSGPYRRPDAA